MTDFLLADSSFVYEGKEGSSTYDKIWVPAVPLGGEYSQLIFKLLQEKGRTAVLPPPKSIMIIVKSSYVSNDSELVAMGDAETLSGLIVNEIESLGKEEEDLLRQSYPSANLKAVYVLEHNRHPAGIGKMFAFLAGGGLLVLIGVGIGIKGMSSSDEDEDYETADDETAMAQPDQGFGEDN